MTLSACAGPVGPNQPDGDRRSPPPFSPLYLNNDGQLMLDEFKSHQVPHGDHTAAFDAIAADGHRAVTEMEYNSHRPPDRPHRPDRPWRPRIGGGAHGNAFEPRNTPSFRYGKPKPRCQERPFNPLPHEWGPGLRPNPPRRAITCVVALTIDGCKQVMGLISSERPAMTVLSAP